VLRVRVVRLLFDISFSIAFGALGIGFTNAVINPFVRVNPSPFSIAFTGTDHDFGSFAQGAYFFICHFMFPFRKE
jgi:hypothetical protein